MARDSLWYRIGYALEQARGVARPTRIRSLTERSKDGRAEKGGGTAGAESDGHALGAASLEGLVATGSGVVLSRLLGRAGAGRPGLTDLARAGVAGAGASLLRELTAPILHGELRRPELDGELGDALLAGAARGLLYAALVEPRLPGPALARGLVYGTAEYLASPWGGLTRLAGKSAPHRRIPLVSGLFEGYDGADDRLVDHLAFAVALAVLYGAFQGGEG